MAWCTRGCLPTRSARYEGPAVQYRLSSLEMMTFKQRFKCAATKGRLSLAMLKERGASFGLGEIAPLTDRIFACITQGTCAIFDDYLRFLDILLRGDEDERIALSYRLISRGQTEALTQVHLSDFLLSIARLSDPAATQLPEEYQDAVFASLDRNHDLVIDFEEYKAAWNAHPHLFVWFGLIATKMGGTAEAKVATEEWKEADVFERLARVEHEIADCMNLLKLEESPSEQPTDTAEAMTSQCTEGSDYSIEEDASFLPQCPILGDRPVLLASKKTEECSHANLSTEATLIRSRSLMGKLQIAMTNLREVHALMRGEKLTSEKTSRCDESWNFVLKVMLGVDVALKSQAADERSSEEEWMRQKTVHSILLLPVSPESINKAFKFTDCFSDVFDRLRVMYGVTRSDFIASLGIQEATENWLLGKNKPIGKLKQDLKNNQFMYFSEDGKYVLSTISKNEFRLLCHILKAYFEYITSHPNSLLIRIFGIYKLTLARKTRQSSLYFTLTSVSRSKKFEVQQKFECPPPSNLPALQLGSDRGSQLVSLLEQDCRFLQSQSLGDYKLVIEMHRLTSEWRDSQSECLHFIPFSEMDEGGLLSSDCSHLYFLRVSSFFSVQARDQSKKYANSFLSFVKAIIK